MKPSFKKLHVSMIHIESQAGFEPSLPALWDQPHKKVASSCFRKDISTLRLHEPLYPGKASSYPGKDLLVLADSSVPSHSIIRKQTQDKPKSEVAPLSLEFSEVYRPRGWMWSLVHL